MSSRMITELSYIFYLPTTKRDLQAMGRIMRAIDQRAKIYGSEALKNIPHTTPDDEEMASRGIVVVPSPPDLEEWLKQYQPKDDA